MKLSNSLLHPIMLPISIVTTLVGFCLSKARENYIRNNFQHDTRLAKILQEIKTQAINKKITIRENIELCVIIDPDKSFISRLFEGFNKSKPIYCHFNTVVIDSKYLEETCDSEIKKSITQCIIEIQKRKPLVNYFLDKSLQLCLLLIIVAAKQLLLINTPVLIGLCVAYAIGFLINLAICKFVDFLQKQNIKKLLETLDAQGLSQGQENLLSPVILHKIPTHLSRNYPIQPDVNIPCYDNKPGNCEGLASIMYSPKI